MTSSARYTYAREILSKKATKIVFTIKRFLANIDPSAVKVRNKLFDALVKSVLLYGCEIRGLELLSYKTHFDKSRTEQVHVKFCKQTLNVPWYTENTACKGFPFMLLTKIRTKIRQLSDLNCTKLLPSQQSCCVGKVIFGKCTGLGGFKGHPARI